MINRALFAKIYRLVSHHNNQWYHSLNSILPIITYKNQLCTKITIRTFATAPVPETHDNAFNVLGIDSCCDMQEVRNAYLKQATKYHPESGSTFADAKKFSQIKEAYRSILVKKVGDVIKEEDFEIHEIPQEKTSDSVVKSKSISELEKEHSDFIVRLAAASIEDYKTGTSQSLERITESAIVARHKKQARGGSGGSIDRMVDELVQMSMRRGDFDNLIGAGKPISYDHRNPMIDTDTYNINNILLNNGCAPDWVMQQSEIRQEMKNARERLSVLRCKILSGEITEDIDKKWTTQVDRFTTTVRQVNKIVDVYNMCVPFLEKQFAHYNAEKDIATITSSHEKYLPKKQEDIDRIYSAYWSYQQNSRPYNENTTFGGIWKSIKSMFS